MAAAMPEETYQLFKTDLCGFCYRVRAFLEQYGIRCFETVVLEVRRGAGTYEPRPRTVAQRMMDGLRGAAYSLRSP